MASESHKAYQLNKTLVLVGMMGSGKTAIGRALAYRLGAAFRDSDDEIVEAAGMSIADIFERDGEPFFRNRETEVISRLMTGAPCVLSTGGGAFLRSENRELIAQDGVSVWLDAPLDLLWERVKSKDTRPLLRTADPRATLSELFEARAPHYAKAALRLKISPAASIEETTEGLVQLLLQARQIRELTQ